MWTCDYASVSAHTYPCGGQRKTSYFPLCLLLPPPYLSCVCTICEVWICLCMPQYTCEGQRTNLGVISCLLPRDRVSSVYSYTEYPSYQIHEFTGFSSLYPISLQEHWGHHTCAVSTLPTEPSSVIFFPEHILAINVKCELQIQLHHSIICITSDSWGIIAVTKILSIGLHR